MVLNIIQLRFQSSTTVFLVKYRAQKAAHSNEILLMPRQPPSPHIQGSDRLGGLLKLLALNGVQNGEHVLNVAQREAVPPLNLDDEARPLSPRPVQPDAELDRVRRDAVGLGVGRIVGGGDATGFQD